MKEDPAHFVPLSHAALYILMSLADEPRHGYGIMLEVARVSESQYKLGPGTLYDNIEKLMENGLVHESKQSHASSDARRRYYELSGLGREVLAADVKRLKAVVRHATTRLNAATEKGS